MSLEPIQKLFQLKISKELNESITEDEIRNIVKNLSNN